MTSPAWQSVGKNGRYYRSVNKVAIESEKLRELMSSNEG